MRRPCVPWWRDPTFEKLRNSMKYLRVGERIAKNNAFFIRVE